MTSGAGKDRESLRLVADESAGEILLYRTEDGRTRVECRFADESLWLSQALIAELFQKDVRTINEHLKNIYREASSPRTTSMPRSWTRSAHRRGIS